MSARGFLHLAISSCVALFLVVTSGAFVRLTGSGLGCENWPSCGDKPYPEQGFHAFVEFGNRLVALVGILLTLSHGSRRAEWTGCRAPPARCSRRVPRRRRTDSNGRNHDRARPAPTRGDGALPLGCPSSGSPWSSRSRRGSSWARSRRTSRPALAPENGELIGLPACALLVVTGAVATASGPHPGSSAEVERLGVAITETVYVHVRVAAAFGIGVLVVGWFLRRTAHDLPRASCESGASFSSRSLLRRSWARSSTAVRCPGVSCSSTSLAATIWALSLVLAYVLWRPPAALARQ